MKISTRLFWLLLVQFPGVASENQMKFNNKVILFHKLLKATTTTTTTIQINNNNNNNNNYYLNEALINIHFLKI